MEDSDGNLRAEDDCDSGEGLNARIVYRADRTGIYRIVATSVGKSRPGAFSFSVRVINRSRGNLPEGLPSWFVELDKNGDGQIALHEWVEGGQNIGEFRRYDQNDDGLITAEEVLRYLNRTQ